MDGLAYDPALHLVYLGTGNGSPYTPGKKPPDSRKITRGDDLYVASIVAVHSETGKLAWYYQEVPGDNWDYDATAKLIQATLEIRGRPRNVLIQASKDGFLYVLDRATGQVLSAKPFSFVNWTSGIDEKTHRPVIGPSTDWGHSPTLLFPNAGGAHSWQPMSYSPKTGLVYIPVMDAPNVYVNVSDRPLQWIDGNFSTAFFFPEDYDPQALNSLFGPLPPLAALSAHTPPPKSLGFIRAYEPASGKLVWEQRTQSIWDGGILSTGSNLVFRGDAAGFLNVYAADTGKQLKQIDVGTAILAAPMTYRVNGVQYVSVMAGYGGGLMFRPFPDDSAALKFGNDGRIVTFRLDGGATPKPSAITEPPFVDAPPVEGRKPRLPRGRCYTTGTAHDVTYSVAVCCLTCGV